MGINIPTRDELIANQLSADQLAKHVGKLITQFRSIKILFKQKIFLIFLGADSLAYLSVDGLETAVKLKMDKSNRSGGHCTACLTGEYPVDISNELSW